MIVRFGPRTWPALLVTGASLIAGPGIVVAVLPPDVSAVGFVLALTPMVVAPFVAAYATFLATARGRIEVRSGRLAWTLAGEEAEGGVFDLSRPIEIQRWVDPTGTNGEVEIAWVVTRLAQGGRELRLAYSVPLARAPDGPRGPAGRFHQLVGLRPARTMDRLLASLSPPA